MFPSHRKIKILLLFAVIVVVIAVSSGKEKVKENSVAIEPQSVQTVEMDKDIFIQSTTTATVSPAVEKKPSAPKPLISAEAYLVANLDTGEIYLDHNSGAVFPIASISKLITAIVSLKNMQADQKIIITQEMLDAYGPAGNLVLGETLTVSELLYPLLLESSNDAAEAFALTYGYSDFIGKMNSFAGGIGMTSTSFRDASGLSPGNKSSARDLLTLARHMYQNEKPLLELSKQKQINLASTTDHGAHIFITINPFPYDPHFIGGKTGRTDEAKESMISLFQYVSNEKSYPIAIIVLRSDFSSREIDSAVLFEKFMSKIR